jgi:phosphatidylserine decarboxylase
MASPTVLGAPHRLGLRARILAQRASSGFAGWISDRRIPRPLRSFVYGAWAFFTGADLTECRLALVEHPSLAAFFVRRLKTDARPVVRDAGLIASPVDGAVQAVGRVEEGTVLQAKGRGYAVRELLAGVGAELDLEGAWVWTLYLSPRDYHRIHAPEDVRLSELRWVGGARHSVAPSVLARRPVLAVNERCVLRLESEHGPLLLVLVGALNVGRIRVVGVEAGAEGPLNPPRAIARGEELGRFELGSTIVLITPPGRARPSPTMVQGAAVRMGDSCGRWLGCAPGGGSAPAS